MAKTSAPFPRSPPHLKLLLLHIYINIVFMNNSCTSTIINQASSGMLTKKYPGADSNGHLLLSDTFCSYCKVMSIFKGLLSSVFSRNPVSTIISLPGKMYHPRVSAREVAKNSVQQSTIITLSTPEVNTVMRALGIDNNVPSGSWDSRAAMKIIEDDFREMFAVEEPSLEELKEAFAVFDDNGDGLIDGVELHMVLCRLGLLEEGSGGGGVERCRGIIRVFDGNGDGVMDFNEFVKFMEKCLL